MSLQKMQRANEMSHIIELPLTNSKGKVVFPVSSALYVQSSREDDRCYVVLGSGPSDCIEVAGNVDFVRAKIWGGVAVL